MITEEHLEQLAIQWFQDTGWSYANGADLAPEGAAPERADFRTVVLKARLAAEVQRLYPKLPPAAVEEVVHVVTTPTETSLPRNNRAFDSFAAAQSGYRPALRAVGLARRPGGSAHRLLMDGVKVEFTNAQGGKETDHAQLIDFQDPAKNDFLVVNQLTLSLPLSRASAQRSGAVCLTRLLAARLSVAGTKKPRRPNLGEAATCKVDSQVRVGRGRTP